MTWPSIQELTNGLEIRTVSKERTTPTIRAKWGPESISSIGPHNRGSKALRVVAPILDIYLSTEHPTTYLPELTSMRRAWSQCNQDHSSDIQQLHHIFIHLTTPFRAFTIQGNQYPFLRYLFSTTHTPFQRERPSHYNLLLWVLQILLFSKEAVRLFQLQCNIPRQSAETDPAATSPASFGPFTLGLYPLCVYSLMIGEIVNGCRGN